MSEVEGLTILPTHNCFDDALEFIVKRINEDNRLTFNGSLRLVHAIVLAPENSEGLKPGQPFAHAWVEEDTEGGILCWDAGIVEGEYVYYGVIMAEYHQHLTPVEKTVYSVRQALLLNLATEHYGPWEPKYQALCRRDDEAGV